MKTFQEFALGESSIEGRELEIFIVNNEDFYTRYVLPVIKNLAKKHKAEKSD